MLYLVPASKSTKSVPGKRRTARINSYKNNFNPKFLVVTTGDYLEISNTDPFFHNTHIFDQNRTLFNIATPSPDISVRKTIPRPGLFSVQCDIHPWMHANIAVVGSPYYSIAWAPGIFKISDIPHGEYRLHVWQTNNHLVIDNVMIGPEGNSTITVGVPPDRNSLIPAAD